MHRVLGYTRADDVEFDGQPSADSLTFNDSYYGDGSVITITTCNGEGPECA